MMLQVEEKQHAVLKKLLKKASSTSIGVKHSFKNIQDYTDFSRRVPMQTYTDIQPVVEGLKKGQQDLSWPGAIKKFAVSAGTSGAGKHLPLSQDRLYSDRRFMRKVVLSYLKQRPNIFNLAGSHLSMPGSVEQKDNFKIGEISGFTAQQAPFCLRMFQIADLQKLTRLSFQQKFDLLLNKALNTDLKIITAVPSWILTLFQRALEQTGKESIAEIWPGLQLLVCGGVKLANYRPHLEKLTHGLSLDYIETYGASEGYIGFSDDLSNKDLKMVIDNGIFFECIPHRYSADAENPNLQKPKPLWEIEPHKAYRLLLSTNAGLWRYTLNDVIEFTSLEPLRFTVKGRADDMLDDFGEALQISEAKHVLRTTANEAGITAGTFAIAPILRQETDIPHHCWFVQFSEPVQPAVMTKIAAGIDESLQHINRHYAIRRRSGALGLPKITSITQADINNWLQQNEKAKAQGKLPKILPKNISAL